MDTAGSGWGGSTGSAEDKMHHKEEEGRVLTHGLGDSVASPGIIEYSFHLATFAVNLFVVSVALFHSWSMHDE